MNATDSERRLLTLWARVLGVPEDRIRRTDNFFEIGGKSMDAARLVVALEHRLALHEVACNAVLSSMAALLDERSKP
ncbi:acyl carrier protein [Streptomyces sp. A7024]|uniref:Acyl carrier protein n=1 Tax=Streptomyces coryli TaxID=1128680 RepID=A0A6G4TV46_9ACTN|nr:acyl carrier protein [Streptomyces coryli]NGN63400.1 acyl carrier protein [Streptomyces coryli]